MNGCTVRRLAGSAAPGFLAFYLLSNLLVRSFSDIWLFIGWTSLCIGMILGGVHRGPSIVFGSLIALLGFHALAVPGSLLWGSGNWELTAGVVMWMAPALLLYLASDPERVFHWLIPAWLVHSGLVIWQGFTNWTPAGDVILWKGNPSGLASNDNLAAGFLALGIVYLLTTPRKWLTAPLLAALLFTGSRWGIMVVAAIILALVLSRTISFRPVIAICALLIGVVVVLGTFTPHGYVLAGINSFAAIANAVTTDVGVRLAIPHLPTLLPSGVAEHPGLHNVPLRIAVENGLIAAGLWILITGWALLKPSLNNRFDRFDKRPNILNRLARRKTSMVISLSPHDSASPDALSLDDLPNKLKAEPSPEQDKNNPVHRFHRWLLFPAVGHFITKPPDKCKKKAKHHDQNNNVHRWLLLTLVLLSVLDYYTWMGHLGGFWWLLIGLMTKSRQS